MFLKQLHLILASGISIINGMTLLEKRVDSKTAHICRQLARHLQKGKTLAEAMQKCPSFFPSLVITLIKAGEQSGQLANVLESLIQYYSKQKELKSFIIKALIYPIFLITASLCVLLFFILYVLPILATAYSAMQAKPNWFLQLVLDLNSFMKQWYLSIILTASVSIYVLYKYRSLLWKILLHNSYCQSIYLLITEARFCKLLALLLNSGISISEAVALAGTTVSNDTLMPKLNLLKKYLQRGVDISQAVQHSLGLFTPLTEELLVIGAETGYLPQMLEEASKIAEDDLQDKLGRIKEFLTPALLLVAALLTAGIVCAIMGPIFELFTAIPEY